MSNVTLIYASDKNNAIGNRGTLPWHSPMELAMFKAFTSGKTLVMGYKTAVSLGRALPGRRNVVLTSRGQAPYENMETVASVEEALALGDIVVVGGKNVYEQFEPHYTEVLYTQMLIEVDEADKFYNFELKDAAEWTVSKIATNYLIEPHYQVIHLKKR